MTRRLLPDPASCPDAALAARWEALLGRAPRLRPWLSDMVGKRRALLEEGGSDVERRLWDEVARWLREFEELPSFAVTAIATTLEDRKERPVVIPHEREAPLAATPEAALHELEALAADPAFALAFHCVETRIRPRLSPFVPEVAWFALLHATAPVAPLLTPDVAVTLVLRILGRRWADVAPLQRRTALRVFCATPREVAARDVRERLCRDLPAEWAFGTDDIPLFLAAVRSARSGFGEAVDLCSRIVAATRGRAGGLAALVVDADAPKASAAELDELRHTARTHAQLQGFGRLLSLVP